MEEFSGLRSDLSDAEWALIAPFMPAPNSVGRPRTTDLREVFNAILYLATTGCQWVQLPKDFPPYSTVQRYFYDWRDSGRLETIRFMLAMDARELEGREASPTAGVIDSQSVKTTESGGIRGYDAGKKIQGRKRHVLMENRNGLVVGAMVTEATGTAEREAALKLVDGLKAKGRITLGADKGYLVRLPKLIAAA